MNQSNGAHDANGHGGVKQPLKVILGTSNMGKEGTPQVTIHKMEDTTAMLDKFQQYQHAEVDCARIYGGGSTEERFGELGWQERGLVMSTKLIPIKRGPFSYSHSKEGIESGVRQSLKALQTDTVDLWYLHLPDHNTPFGETLEAVNTMFHAGIFKRFGISSFAAWEVSRICELCERHGWKKPDVYSGLYNPLQRLVEPELLPCLRHYGIAFYMFRPLGKGLLTNKAERGVTKHGKVDQSVKTNPVAQAKASRGETSDVEFDALDIIRAAASKLDMTVSEVTLRWASHHSLLDSSLGDGVIIGASSPEQLEENLSNLQKGPLPDEMVEAFGQAWGLMKSNATTYFL